MSATSASTALWDARRRAFFETRLRPRLDEVVAEHRWIRSVAILVAQYWSDEADDAVHASVVFSQLDTPDIDAGLCCSRDRESGDTVNLPDGLTRTLRDGSTTSMDHWDLLMCAADGSRRSHWAWDSNGVTIPLFAAFCAEGSHQEMSALEAYRLWTVARPTSSGSWDLEPVVEQLRPWLDGVMPLWEEDADPDDEFGVAARLAELDEATVAADAVVSVLDALHRNNVGSGHRMSSVSVLECDECDRAEVVLRALTPDHFRLLADDAAQN